MKKWIALFFTVAFMLAACHNPVYNQAEGNVADVKLKASAARKKSDDSAKTPPALVMKQGLYVDTTPISLEKQPSWLRNQIVIRGEQLPFSYYSRTIAAGAGRSILTRFDDGLDPNTNVTINYSGTIKGALELLASKSGYVYSIRHNTLVWKAFVTRTFDVAFMPGSSDYLLGSKAGGNGGTSAAGNANGAQVSNYVTSDLSSAEFSSLKGSLSLWKDLESTIKGLLSKEGSVTVSEATTTITVRDRPSNVDLIAQYINNMNSSLSRQVLVKVQVLEVTLSSDFNFGINWGLVANAFHHTPFVINANYGTPISISAAPPQDPITGALALAPALLNGNNPPGNPLFGLLGNGKIPSYTLLLDALSQQGKTSVVSEPRVVCLNNQVSVVRITNQQSYVASVQNTTLAGASTGTEGANNTVTSQVTPGSVVTGLTLYILPKILKDKIYIQVNADLSNALAFTTFQGSGIQLPNVTEKHFNQRSVIKSGDTLILSGFRQVTNQAAASQFINSQALGGKSAIENNTETVVLITPIILHGSA